MRWATYGSRIIRLAKTPVANAAGAAQDVTLCSFMAGTFSSYERFTQRKGAPVPDPVAGRVFQQPA